MNVLEKLTDSVKEHGVYYTLGSIVYKLDSKIDLFFDHRFDRTFGVRTCGNVETEDLDIESAQKSAAQHYEPTPVSALRAILKALSVDHSQYAFIDLGSGKGRALLLASEYPYKQIIGVEFSQNLHEIATNNLKTWKNPQQQCFDVKSICADACDFQLPDVPLVLFFFTPFKSSVTNQVIDNIKKSVSNNPRSIWILYYGANQEFIALLMKLNFACREIFSHRRRKGILFWSESPPA
jgi:SAM-dependent methyltransferase